jgi:formylglycine-generating enzyme required for sulfatase activity
MRWIPGGTFLMGSESFYPEERPVHQVEVDGVWMDEHPVTAAEFRRFVREIGYVRRRYSLAVQRLGDLLEREGCQNPCSAPKSRFFAG